MYIEANDAAHRVTLAPLTKGRGRSSDMRLACIACADVADEDDVRGRLIHWMRHERPRAEGEATAPRVACADGAACGDGAGTRG